MVHVCTCKVSRKYINAFLSYSAKTKRDGQTDGQTDRQTDGRGALQYLPSRAFGAAGDKNILARLKNPAPPPPPGSLMVAP